MAKKRQKSNNSKSLVWPTVLAAVAILVGIAWNDQAKEKRTQRKIPSSVNERIQASEPIKKDDDTYYCEVVMAESAFPHKDRGWGMFTLVPVDPGDPVFYGELAIQLTDLMLPKYRDDIRIIFNDYVWSEFVGGGVSEGSSVYSALPGIGSLANGHADLTNVSPYVPDVNNAELTRDASPGAGAITHYHNQFWRARSRPLSAGDEIVVDYGSQWTGRVSYDQHGPPRRSVNELRETGICLANIRPQQSTNVEAGRGAFAVRFLKEGTVIAPAPLITINSREALAVLRNGTDMDINGQQLLLNYCFGHKNSSLLFFPYSPMVNLINHDSVKTNAKLQWSESPLHFGREWLEWPLDKVKALDHTGLLLEFVATRDIQEGEEIFIDYGRDWENAWKKHKAEWKPVERADKYKYPYELEEQKGILITEADSNESYPSNVETACFYHYGENKDVSGTVKWALTRNSALMSCERPCRLLRKDVDSGGTVLYTAEILNRNPVEEDNVPDGQTHIVTHIPRTAIVVTNKKYSSDQHLPNAFRHEIGLSDEIFPQQWIDLQ